MSQKIGMVTRTIQRDLASLQKGILTREGGRKDGRWVILKPQAKIGKTIQVAAGVFTCRP